MLLSSMDREQITRKPVSWLGAPAVPQKDC